MQRGLVAGRRARTSRRRAARRCRLPPARSRGRRRRAGWGQAPPARRGGRPAEQGVGVARAAAGLLLQGVHVVAGLDGLPSTASSTSPGRTPARAAGGPPRLRRRRRPWSRCTQSTPSSTSSRWPAARCWRGPAPGAGVRPRRAASCAHRARAIRGRRSASERASGSKDMTSGESSKRRISGGNQDIPRSG